MESQAAQAIKRLERPVEIVEARKIGYVSLKDSKMDFRSMERLVQSLISPNTMALLIGESGAGKTFVALQIAFCIASGLDFLGLKTKPGIVIYIATEAGVSILTRLEALKKAYPYHVGAPLYIIPERVDFLSDQNDADEVIRIAKEIEASVNGKVVMVVTDTVNRAMNGGDENSPADMGGFISSMERIQTIVGCTVLGVHHCGKDTTKGARGHSSLKAAVDTEITITQGLIKATKQRDLPLGEPIGFRLEPLEVGRTEDGEAITSCLVKPASVDFAISKPRLNERSLQALEVLRAISKELGPPAVLDVWKRRFWNLHCAGLSPSARANAFRRAAEELQLSNLVQILDGIVHFTSQGVHT